MERNQAGYSFLEVLIALFIVAVVLLPLIAIELQVHQQDDRVDVQTRALLAGREKIEELMATSYSDLAEGSDSLALEGGQRTLQRDWSVAFDTPAAEMATLTVVVRERVAEGIGLGNAPAATFTTVVRE